MVAMVPFDARGPLFLFQANGTFIVQPKMTNVKGFCHETNASLILVFKEGHITFMFNKVLLMSLKMNLINQLSNGVSPGLCSIFTRNEFDESIQYLN